MEVITEMEKTDRSFLEEEVEEGYLCPACAEDWLYFAPEVGRAICPKCKVSFSSFRELFEWEWGAEVWLQWLERHPEYTE